MVHVNIQLRRVEDRLFVVAVHVSYRREHNVRRIAASVHPLGQEEYRPTLGGDDYAVGLGRMRGHTLRYIHSANLVCAVFLQSRLADTCYAALADNPQVALVIGEQALYRAVAIYLCGGIPVLVLHRLETQVVLQKIPCIRILQSTAERNHIQFAVGSYLGLHHLTGIERVLVCRMPRHVEAYPVRICVAVAVCYQSLGGGENHGAVRQHLYTPDLIEHITHITFQLVVAMQKSELLYITA